MSRSERFGVWLGAIIKVVGCWAAFHLAFVAEDEQLVFRVLAAVWLYFMVRDAHRAAVLHHRLKSWKVP